MKRAMIALVVAGLVFGVAAFAGGFAVDTAELNSGGGDVPNCVAEADGEVEVDFTVGPHDTTGFPIEEVTVTAPEECAGLEARVALLDQFQEEALGLLEGEFAGGPFPLCETGDQTLSGPGDEVDGTTTFLLDDYCGTVYVNDVLSVSVLIGDYEFFVGGEYELG